MNKILIYALSAAICMYFASCKKNTSDELSHHHHHHEHTDHHHDHDADHHHDEDGDEEAEDGEITLSPAMAERFGVATEKAVVAPFADALKVSGTILSAAGDAAVIAAPSSGILSFNSGIECGANVKAGATIARVSASGVTGGDTNAAAKANLDVAKRELDRLTPLYADRLVTASAYNEAMRNYEQAKATYSAGASAGIISSPITGVITSIDVLQGQYVEVGTPVATVAKSARLTLRADVPQRYFSRLSSVSDARVTLPYTDSNITLSSLNGRRVASGSPAAPTAAPGYSAVYFTFDNDGSFIPGSGVDVYLLADAADNVVSVPVSALSEQQGLYYVFVRLDDECYRKVPVVLGRNNGDRVEIRSGVNPGDDVVVAGTTTVRIAESSGVVPEGHSHNH